MKRLAQDHYIFFHDREIPLYSVSDAEAHCYTKIQLLCDLTIKHAWRILVKDFLNHFILLQI